MESKIVHHLAKHIREVYFGVNWTWSNIRDNLSDVSLKQALFKVEGFNTIAALTYHIHYYVASIKSVLSGGPLIGKDKYSFDHPDFQSEIEWMEYVAKIFEEAEELALLVEKLEEEQLWETFGEEKYGNYYRNIQGFIEHSHYHLGQIVVLKKLASNLD